MSEARSIEGLVTLMADVFRLRNQGANCSRRHRKGADMTPEQIIEELERKQQEQEKIIGEFEKQKIKRTPSWPLPTNKDKV